MESFKNIIMFCGLCGVVILCAILVITAVLRWLVSDKDEQARGRRLTTIAKCAFAVLVVMIVWHYLGSTDISLGNEESARIVDLLLSTAKIMICSLAAGVVVLSAATLLFVFVFCIYRGIKNIIWTGKERGPNEKSAEKLSAEAMHDALINTIRAPVVKLVLSLGVLSIFIILPFLVGNQAAESPIEVWKDGVQGIVGFIDLGVDNGSDRTPSYFLTSYILVYIMVLGVCYAIVKILCSILDHTFKLDDANSLLDEYSSPIALLVVGIAFLWFLKDGGPSKGSRLKITMELLKSFGMVVFIVAVIILVLEIIHLLIDMREVLIRQEGRILFIAVVGQSAMLLLEVCTSIYSAVNSAVGGKESAYMNQTVSKLRRQIIDRMEEQIGDKKNYEMTFSAFDKKITKK